MNTVCMKTRSTQKGIGLLELMLSLAIIAILLIMATRYFNSARLSQKVNETVTLIQAMTSGASSLSGSGTAATSITEANLVSYVPSIYQNGAGITSPFGSAVTASGAPNASSSTGYSLTIKIATLPVDACNALAGSLKNVAVPSVNSGYASDCDSSGNYTGTFPI